ncbi:MAG: hypothetical protein ACM3UU_01440 [Ignavibacteriales bacterium]
MKKGQVILTKRDKELLRSIAENGFINNETAGRIYGTKQYHENRMSILRKEHYITRRKKYVYLGAEGKRYVEKQGIKIRPIPLTKGLKKRGKETYEMAEKFDLSAWTFTPSWILKKQRNMNRGGMFYGMIRSDKINKEYIIYNLGTEANKRQTGRIKKELVLLGQADIERAIVFFESEKAKETYILRKDDNTKFNAAKNVYLLPYNERSLTMLNKHGIENLLKTATELVYGDNYKARQMQEADCTIQDDKQLFVMIFNDVHKKASLKLYNELGAMRNRIVILCLKEDEEEYRKAYPNFDIKTITYEELVKGSSRTQ